MFMKARSYYDLRRYGETGDSYRFQTQHATSLLSVQKNCHIAVPCPYPLAFPSPFVFRPLVPRVAVSFLALEGSAAGSDFPSSSSSSGGGGVFGLGGAEAGAASGSSGVATGGTTTPIGAEGSGALAIGAAAGASKTGAAGKAPPGRARRAAFAPSVTAFIYMSAESKSTYIPTNASQTYDHSWCCSSQLCHTASSTARPHYAR